MPSPSSSLSTLRPDLASSLEEFDLEANREGFIGGRILPTFNVPKQSGTWGKIPVEQLMKTADTKRAAKAGYSRDDFEFEPDSWITEEHGAEHVIDDREDAIYSEYFDSEVIATGIARNKVLMNKEIRVAAAIYNPTTFSGQTTGVTEEWDDLENAVPLNNIETAVRAVYMRCGIWPNALVINKLQFRNLRRCKQILDLVKYQGFQDVRPQAITANALAQLFDLDEVIVAGGIKNTANEAKAAVFSQIWSDEYAALVRIPSTNNIKEVCTGRSFHWAEDGSMPDGVVESYRQEEVRGDVIRVRHESNEKLIYSPTVQLLDNVTT